MKLTKSGKPSHAKNPNARKKKPVQHFDTIKSPKYVQWSQILRTYNAILDVQTPDDIERSWEAIT